MPFLDDGWVERLRTVSTLALVDTRILSSLHDGMAFGFSGTMISNKGRKDYGGLLWFSQFSYDDDDDTFTTLCVIDCSVELRDSLSIKYGENSLS